jgi:protein transport protein SEC39
VLLEAAQYAADSDLLSLHDVVARHQDWLCLDVVLRIILTYLPESVEPSRYLELLDTLSSWDADPAHQDLGKGPPASGIDQPTQPLHLVRIVKWNSIHAAHNDIFEEFLVERAHRIDRETGSLVYIHDLIEPFANRSEALETWFGATILPLARLDYAFYPELAPAYTLESFERLSGRSGVYALLFELLRRNKEEDGPSYGRDFRGILAPWVQGEAWKMSMHQSPKNSKANNDEELSMENNPLSKLWSDVLGTLLDHAVEHPSSVISLIQNWEGPHDSHMEDALVHLPSLDPAFADEKYIQLMLALLYVEQDGVGKLSTEQESMILRRAGILLEVKLSVDPKAINLDSRAEKISHKLLGKISLGHLHHDELLDSGNPLTEPSATTVQLGAFLATSRALMASLEDPLPMHATASLCLFGHAADQRARMQKILNGLAAHSATGDSFWRDARTKLLWLHRWNIEPGKGAAQRSGLFSQIELREMEVGILKTLARIGRKYLRYMPWAY